jgi:hypothetical protein
MQRIRLPTPVSRADHTDWVLPSQQFASVRQHTDFIFNLRDLQHRAAPLWTNKAHTALVGQSSPTNFGTFLAQAAAQLENATNEACA